MGTHLAARCRVSEFGVVGLRAESFGHVRPVGRAAPSDVNSLGEFPAHVAPSAPPPVPVVKTIGREGEKGMRGRRKYPRYGNPHRRVRRFSQNTQPSQGNAQDRRVRPRHNPLRGTQKIRSGKSVVRNLGRRAWEAQKMEIYFLVARVSRPLQAMYGYFCFWAIFAFCVRRRGVFPALVGRFASLLFREGRFG